MEEVQTGKSALRKRNVYPYRSTLLSLYLKQNDHERERKEISTRLKSIVYSPEKKKRNCHIASSRCS